MGAASPMSLLAVRQQEVTVMMKNDTSEVDCDDE
jgi:hypothetical protein